MYCRHCGKELKGESNYCRYCGGQLKSVEKLYKEKKKLQRETTLYSAFSIFVIVIFIFSIIIIQSNPSLVKQDKKEVSNQTEDQTDDRREVSNIEDKINDTKIKREEASKLGSAKVLEGDNILISIFVDISGDEWTEEEKEYCQDSLEEAVTWIEKEGEKYDKQIHFIYDMDMESDLLYYQSIDFEVQSDIEQLSYYHYNNSWIEDNIDMEAIEAKYDTDSIGYLFFLKDDGTSYTYPHYLEDKNFYIEEMCTIYLGDSSNYGYYETPATYAHEILHLYGALDLYKNAAPKDINDYVKDTYPYEVMLSTYDELLLADGDNEVKIISPITAYMLDWIDDIDELSMFPLMERNEGACFSVEDFGGYNFEDEENKE